MSDSLGSPPPTRKRETSEDLFDKLQRQCARPPEKGFFPDDTPASPPSPPAKTIDPAKLWTTVHVDIYSVGNTPPEESDKRTVKKPKDSDDDDLSSESRSDVYDDSPFLIKRRDKTKCVIHSESFEPVGLFEDLPDRQCSNPNCQFYVSPSVLNDKSKRGKKRNYGPKSSKSPATPSKRHKTFCPLPITSGESRCDSLEKARSIERNALRRTPPEKEKSPIKTRIRHSTAESPCNSNDEQNKGTDTNIHRSVFSDDDDGGPFETPLTRREQQKRFFWDSDKNRRINTRRTPNIMRKVPSAVRVDISRDDYDSPTDEILPTNRTISAYDTTPPRDADSPLPECGDPLEIGLANKGNTCYLNATFQSLFVLKDFVKDLDRLFRDKENPHPCLKLFNSLALARKNGLPRRVDKDLTQFIENFRLTHKTFSRIGQQQDASEFLDKFLEIVRNGSPIGQPNPTEVHFLCQLYETLRCVGCDRKLTRTQNYFSLCLPITEEYETLDDCLGAFLAEDEREGTCENCGSTNKKVSYCFETLPKTLILVMKRYLNNQKVSKEITAPDVLDLKKYIKPEVAIETKLKMVAKISHVGPNISSGHYVAHTLNDDGFWRLYDDATVIKVAESWNAEHKEAAYMYFYQLVPP